MAVDWCCDDMRYHATTTCDVHDRADCPDVVMTRFVNSDGKIWYGLPIHDGGSSAIKIKRCPWCGRKLKGR